MIIEDLLLSYGADYKNYKTNETIFSESEIPSYYFQIIKGTVKINNYNDNGKEASNQKWDKIYTLRFN